LSDGKRGHLNQSLAALDVIKRCRRDAGFEDEDTLSEIIDVRFRSRFSKTLLSVLAVFASHIWQGDMRLMRFCLDGDSYRKISRAYADIVISCGSSLSGANLFLSRENNARNVVIMRPSMVGAGRFDVAIIPRHDRPGRRDNVIITDGSPNLISTKVMRSGGAKMRRLGIRKEKKTLGLLLGGDTPEHSLTPKLADRLISDLEGLLEEKDMQLLVTTSRRTPEEVERLIKKRMGTNKRCSLMVIANEKNMDNAVGGILDLSDIVLVSGDSISMISEAASSGKRTVVFDLKKKRFFSKHDRAITRMAAEGYVIRTQAGKVRDTIESLDRDKCKLKVLDNSERMYKKLYRII
jgi:mitochondrial fission protein ELM1